MIKETKVGNYRWFICFILFAATTINHLDRQILGLLKPTLEKTFSWTETDYSHIVMALLMENGNVKNAIEKLKM